MQLCFGGDLFAGPPVCDSNSVNEWPWRHPQMWADVLLRHSLGAFLTLQSLEESLLVHACLRATLNRKMGMWCSFLITTRQVDYCKNVCVCVHFFFLSPSQGRQSFFASSSCSQWSSWNTITPLTQPLTIEDDLLLHTHSNACTY